MIGCLQNFVKTVMMTLSRIGIEIHSSLIGFCYSKQYNGKTKLYH